MELGKKEIMKYGKYGLTAFGTGKRAYELAKELPLFHKRKQTRMMKKETKQIQRRESWAAYRASQRGNLYRLRVMGRILLTLQRRYF